MGYDHDDSFPFDFEPNASPFGSKLSGKLSPRSYPIQCERKWKHSFISVQDSFRDGGLDEEIFAKNGMAISTFSWL